MSKTVDVKVPDIGGEEGVPIIEVLVQPGDVIEAEASLVVLESEKATMEVPSTHAGTVKALKVKVGDKLSEGDVILTLDAAGEEASDAPADPVAAPPPTPRQQQSGAGPTLPHKGGGSESAAVASPRPPPPPVGRGRGEGSRTSSASGSTVEVRVPDIGDYEGVPVIEVFVKDGDTVGAEDSLLTLESEKATMEVPSPAGGMVRGLKVKVGDKVSQGDLVCSIEGAAQDSGGDAQQEVPPPPVGGDQGEGAAAPAPPPTPTLPHKGGGSSSPSAPDVPPWESQKGKLPHASPAIRRFARELGVDLAQVKGSGRKGRITREDVQGFVKEGLKSSSGAGGGAGIPAIPPQDFSKFGEVETVPLARIRKISAAHLHRAWLNVPHVTQQDEADITDLEAFRKEQNEANAKAGGPKLTLLPFILKAVSLSLREYPEFNASLGADGESLVMKKYCHVGFAADTPNGLVVPVVRDVWAKGITILAGECGTLAKKARDGKLKPDEMRGGCFSVSSLGGIGGSHFTPIVNAPEVGILGVSRAQVKPVWNGRKFKPRLICPLSLSYDHRVIDGAYAARFIVHLVAQLSDLRRLAL